MESYLDEKQVSKIIGRSLSALRQDRMKGQGIPYIKFNRLCRYKLSDVVSFMDRHRIETKDHLINE